MRSIRVEVLRAREAQPAWAAKPLSDRLRVLRLLRHALATRADEFVAAVDRGRQRAPGETIAAEVLPMAEAVRFLEKHARAILAPERWPASPFPLWLKGVELEIRRDPLGVVLIVGPSNYPLMLPGIQAVQALVAGNSVILKPGTGGLPAMEVFRGALLAAGLDSNLCRVLGESPEDAKAAVHEGVDKVFLTGSAATGREVLSQLASRLIPAVMELSGCDAVFVREDADLELTVRGLVFGLRLNAGATCIGPRRVIVHRHCAEELQSQLIRALETGPHSNLEGTLAGRVRDLVTEATDKGAVLLSGVIERDNVRGPLLVGRATPAMRLLQEDVPAPVLSLQVVDSDEEALAVASSCPYALGASVFGSEREAQRLARRVRAGAVVVNDVIAPTAHPRLAFGGRGWSGFGVTRGREGLLEMTTLKAICVRHGRWRPHFDAPDTLTGDLLKNYLVASHGATLRERIRAAVSCLRLARRRGSMGGFEGKR
jgi:acyl-CoA reductase-like NAD-dependent aldehyde dehydrogenase